MSKVIRIGTRESPLALWQARQVSDALETLAYSTEIVPVRTDGEISPDIALYEAGIQGIFTRALDVALLNNEIDIAVHSLKDVPTRTAKGLHIAAVMQREDPLDVMVCRNADTYEEIKSGRSICIATGSIRRSRQWLLRYPGTVIENLRGNIQTRLHKLHRSDWQGAIFATAALKRLKLTEKETGPCILLDWMLPAPAQGAVAVVSRDEEYIKSICSHLNHVDTHICTGIERDFLRLMQGGCSSPIGALAVIDKHVIRFEGNIVGSSGTCLPVVVSDKKENYAGIAAKAVQHILSKQKIPVP